MAERPREQEREEERTGRTTSWIHRGIWIVGPGPAIARIVQLSRRAPGGDLATVRAMETPRSRHGARLRADRRRAQARARRIAVGAVIARPRGRDARADGVRQPERRARGQPAGSAAGHLGAAGCRRCSRPSEIFGSSRPSPRAASPRSASTGARTGARAEARRPAGATKGCSRGCGAGSRGRREAASPGTSSREARSGRSTSAPSQEPTSTRRSTGRSSRFATRSSRDARSGRRSSCGRRRRRRSSSRSRTCGPILADRRRERRRWVVEARHGDRTSAGSSNRRSSDTRADGGNNVSIQVFPSATLGVP